MIELVPQFLSGLALPGWSVLFALMRLESFTSRGCSTWSKPEAISNRGRGTCALQCVFACCEKASPLYLPRRCLEDGTQIPLQRICKLKVTWNAPETDQSCFKGKRRMMVTKKWRHPLRALANLFLEYQGPSSFFKSTMGKHRAESRPHAMSAFF